MADAYGSVEYLLFSNALSVRIAGSDFQLDPVNLLAIVSLMPQPHVREG